MSSAAAERAAKNQEEAIGVAQAGPEHTHADDHEESQKRHEDERRPVDWLLIESAQLLGCQSLVAPDDFGNARHTLQHALVEVAVAERGQERFPNDDAGESVRQHALEAVADFDANLPLGRRHEHQHAVVAALLPDPRP